MRRILFLLICGIAGTGLLLALGVWQVQRLGWKRALLAEIETRIAAEPGPLPAAPDPQADRYLPVRASGEILPGEIQVLVSRKEAGPGYRVIAPFRVGDGRRILLDRGFVPQADKGVARTLGPAEVTGNLHWPQERDGFTPAPDLAANIWFARDVPEMAAALGSEPLLLVARSRTDPGVTPLPVDTAGIPDDHLNYAITWFALALVWAAMTGFFLRRDRARNTDRGT